jgi:hypothetical protein
MSLLSKLQATAVAVVLASSALPAHAVLERVGPPSAVTSIGGFPIWYQDTTGLALEFCNPQNLTEVAGGWCLLLPANVTVAPEVFPTNFFDEHFYFAASSAPLTLSNGSKALLIMAEEAAFATGNPVPGAQITFSRIRISIGPIPATGTYRIIHPYGEELFDGVAGNHIFFTEDIGIGCSPGSFDCSLNSRLGPFLLPSATPGGAEMPPLTAATPTPDTNPAHFGGVFAPTPYPGTGKAYLADPARIGPVTGSSLPPFTDSQGKQRNHNMFRVEGPAGSTLGLDPVTGAAVDFVETTDFSLMGRVFTGVMPGQVTVEGAHYATNSTNTDRKLDVFATAFPTTSGRLPLQPRPTAAAPQLTFFDAPCAGTVDPATLTVHPPFSAPAGAVETQMFADGNAYWGNTHPTVIPSSVCVKDATARDANGNLIPSFIPQVVTDEVTISQALYDRGTGTLTVAASSSDVAAPPTLTLAYGTVLRDLVNGQVAVRNLLAPPGKVRVLSSNFGESEYQVSTSFAAGAPPSIPVANNDSFTFLEDSGLQSLVVTANDSNTTGGIVTLTSAPRLGIALVDASGAVTFTPNLNANGADAFTYNVTVGTQVSNTATVTLNITPVNDPPVAVNDNFSAIANQSIQLNLLANDTDPDGAPDLANAVLVTSPAAGATVTGGAGGLVTFNATAGGTFIFTYQAQDRSLTPSGNTATVTVQVAAAETLTIVRAEFVRSKNRLRVQGTIAPDTNQTITVDFISGTGAVLGRAGTVVEVAGAWVLDTTVPLPAGTTAVRATSSSGTARALALTLK